MANASGWRSRAGDCLRVAAGDEPNLGSRSSHGPEARSGHRRSRRQGKITAIGLAVLGARVGITGRDPARSQAAAENIRAASAVTSRAVTFRGHGQPAGESRRRFRLGECYGPVADGMKAQSWRCPDYAAQAAHGERRVTARYAMLCSAGAAF